MTSLRCAEGIDIVDFERRFGTKQTARLREMAARWVGSGDLIDVGGALRIPTARFLISDAVIESLFEV